MKRLINTAIAIATMTISMMAGDLKITFNTETKAMFRNQKSTETHYYSSRYKFVRNEKEKKDALTDYDTFVTYDIDHKKKTIQKITMDDMAKLMEFVSALMEENKDAKNAVEKMLGGNADGTVSVKQEGTEVVIGRTCNKWRIAIGNGIVSNFSVDATLEYPMSQAAIEKGEHLRNATMMMLPGMGESLGKFTEEMTKIKGIRLKAEMQIKIGPMTLKNSIKVVKIEEGAIPASVFELPKDYKEEEPVLKALEEASKKLEEAKKKK